jgi:hypothetical protein
MPVEQEATINVVLYFPSLKKTEAPVQSTERKESLPVFNSIQSSVAITLLIGIS